MKKTILAAVILSLSSPLIHAAPEVVERGFIKKGSQKIEYVLLANGDSLTIDAYNKLVEESAQQAIKEAQEKLEQQKRLQSIVADHIVDTLSDDYIAATSEHKGDCDKISDTGIRRICEGVFNTKDRIELSRQFNIRIATNDGSGIVPIATLPLDGKSIEVTNHEVLEEPITLHATIDFEAPDAGVLTVDVSHSGIYIGERKPRTFMQKLYLPNPNIPSEKTTVKLAVNQSIILKDRNGRDIIFSLVKSN